jgi:hypothetical protein
MRFRYRRPRRWFYAAQRRDPQLRVDRRYVVITFRAISGPLPCWHQPTGLAVIPQSVLLGLDVSRPEPARSGHRPAPARCGQGSATATPSATPPGRA